MSWDIASLAPGAAVLVSLFALVVSALSLFYSRLDRRPRLILSISSEEVEYESDDEWGPPPPEELIFLDISNPGEKRVKVNNIVIEWNKANASYPDFQTEPRKKPPFLLPPSDNAVFTASTDDFLDWLRAQGARGAIKIRAKVVDALGNRYHSARISLVVPPVEP
jgi:hypothetical protein